MTKEDMLEELTKVRVELLNEETRLLFDTIMSEFDKRDNYKNTLDEIREYIVKDIQECTYGQVSKYQYILEIIKKVDDNND